MTQTFYDVLGVQPDASTDEIRAAYRERLKESHPDLNEDDDARERTRRVIRARDVLTDEDERERYDRVGHAEFVGNTDSGVDDDDVSDAAAAARRAGWASGAGDGPADSDSSTDASRSRADGRRRARQRRRRERAASERVRDERVRGTSEAAGAANERTRETGSARASTDATGTSAGTSTDGGAAAASGTATASASNTGRSWREGNGYSVRQEYDTGFQERRLVPSGKALTLLAVAFVLYPLMLFSALFPPFPLVVNVVVGLCTVFLVGYLQSVPNVGLVVFGAWSLLVPVAFVVAGVPLTGLVGIVALAGTWLPLGLSALTFTMVPP